MTVYLCETCGTQYPDRNAPPDECPTCSDERQWVPKSGQRWIARDELYRKYTNTFRHISPGLLGITTTPQFGIGQRAISCQDAKRQCPVGLAEPGRRSHHSYHRRVGRPQGRVPLTSSFLQCDGVLGTGV